MQSKSGSLLQKTQIAPIFAQVSQHITNTLKQHQFKRNGWTKIFQLLASVTQSPGVQADQGAVQAIIDLCDEILEKISQSREIERKDYQHWVDEYQTTRDGLTERANEVQHELDEIASQIAVLNKRITLAQQEKKEQDERVKDKTQQREDKTQWCDDENGAYAERRQSRDDDRDVVSDAIALFNAQIRTFRKYVSKRTAGVTKANL